MRGSWRRAWATVADLLKIIDALDSALGKLVLFGEIFREFVDAFRYVIHHPVHPRAVRRVRIIDY